MGIAAVSNNFSLARMFKAVGDGCIASSDAAWRPGWPHLPADHGWSAGARLFPAGDAATAPTESWPTVYCDDNFERLARAKELAAQRVECAGDDRPAWCSTAAADLPAHRSENLEELSISLEALNGI
jgi:hypothetical protein